MNITLNTTTQKNSKVDLTIHGLFTKNKKSDFSYLEEKYLKTIKSSPLAKNFTAQLNNVLPYNLQTGESAWALGLGENPGPDSEDYRELFFNLLNKVKSAKVYRKIELDIPSFLSSKSSVTTTELIALAYETFHMQTYKFDNYKSQNSTPETKLQINLRISAEDSKEANKVLTKTKYVLEGVDVTRDLINLPPNDLTAPDFATYIQKDVKKNLKGVSVKVLNKKQIEKEKMNLLLGVNKGSGFEPRVVHLSYSPTKVNKNTKHICLVGKGLTFDSGGYSLKVGGFMVGMKMDMGGAATVYGAFRNAVKLKSPHKISLFLGMTDNMIAPDAITPDTVIKSRNGKFVEILNTDAEGRLVLADVLDYACEKAKPDVLIDAATLTGACVRALDAVCGVMGNDDELINEIIDSGKANDEQLWQLPITKEYRKDILSKVADIKNLSGNPNAGSQKAGAFLEHFVKKGVKWAHLDVAGVAYDIKSHAPQYNCPSMASGLIVRTLSHYLVK